MASIDPPAPAGPRPEPVMLPSLFDEVLDVRRLALRPGDVIVVRTPERLSPEACERIAMQVKARFLAHEVLVLGAGIDIGVVGPEEPAEG